jgi:hypothetical protein
MNTSDYLRDPVWAALFAGAVTAAYIHIKANMNNEGQLPLSSYMKPGSLVALLVYFIVQQGTAAKESILSDPF